MSLTWLETIASVIEIVRAGIDAVRAIPSNNRFVAKDLTIEQIQEQMSSGSLNIGDRITCIGTFSPYLPFVDLRNLITKTRTSIPDFHIHCTCRLDSIKNTYCGALYNPEQNIAAKVKKRFLKAEDGTKICHLTRTPNPSIPILYSKQPVNRHDKGLRLSNYRAGDILELACEIRELPDDWRKIIASTTAFTFEDVEGTLRPFCLKVLDVKPYGTFLDEFRIDLWIAAHLNMKRLESHAKTNPDASRIRKMLGLVTEMSEFRPLTVGLSNSSYDVKTNMVRAWSHSLVLFGYTNINILNPAHVDYAKRSIPLLLTELVHGADVVDFQCDQIHPMCAQSITVSELLGMHKT